MKIIKVKKSWKLTYFVLFVVVVFMGTLLVKTSIEAVENLDITVYVDGEKVQFDTQPVIRDNRTLVPIRGVLEKLGAVVDWNQETKQAIVKNDDIEILLEIDNAFVLVNGRLVELDTQSLVIDNRTLVPLRFIAETLGYKVDWNGKTHRIDIQSGGSQTNIIEGLPKVGNVESLAQLLKYSQQLNTYVNMGFDDMSVGQVLVEPLLEESVSPDAEMDMLQDNVVKDESAANKTTDDYSNTNNQVEGVEEGDITKTDGKYIFYTKNNQVFIIDSDPEKPSILNTIDVDSERGYIRDIYIQDQKLVIIGTSYTYYIYPALLREGTDARFAPSYGTNNSFILVYDFTDIEKLDKVLDMDFEGTYVSSRLVEDKLYMVTNKSLNYYDIQRLSGVDVLEEKEKELYDYQLKPKYADNISGTTNVIEFMDMYYFPEYIKPNYLMTIGVDLSTNETSVNAYLGQAENVYATTENMYLTFTNYEYTHSEKGLIYVPNYKVNTAIYKFGLDQGSILYAKEGKVAGTVLNQFSLNEYEGNLQIATTKGEMWNQDNPSENNVFVLDSELKQIGALTGLAKGERIYSTRFAGERIYMVTYRQVDPFFVIDAKDPTNPVVLGELKIPGFSTYLHILDANHVLGFGTETNEIDGVIRQSGFKLSLFDVTDPVNPVEKKKEVIGLAGTYSELANNHKALLFSLSKGIMGFPITISGKTPYATDFDGAYVYTVSEEDFNYKGNITHQESEKLSLYSGNGIERLLYIGDYLYSISANKLKVTSLSDMEAVSELLLPTTSNSSIKLFID